MFLHAHISAWIISLSHGHIAMWNVKAKCQLSEQLSNNLSQISGVHSADDEDDYAELMI